MRTSYYCNARLLGINEQNEYLPQGQHAELVAPGDDEGGQETNVGELEQGLLGGYPLAVGLVERRVRPTDGGAVERVEQCRVGRVVVRVIVVIVVGRPVRRDRAVLHGGRHHRTSCCCTGAVAGTNAFDAAAGRCARGGVDRVPQTGARRRWWWRW